MGRVSLFTAHRTLITFAIVLGVAFAVASATHVEETGRAAAVALVIAGCAAALAFGAYLVWFVRRIARRR